MSVWPGMPDGTIVRAAADRLRIGSYTQLHVICLATSAGFT
jgi:hypothetical protein